jgi:hypothetical protein
MRVKIIRRSHQRALWHIGGIDGVCRCGQRLQVDAIREIELLCRNKLIEDRKLCRRCWRSVTR